MTMQVSLGAAIGKAYMHGEGLCTVFATERPGKFTVQVDRSGPALPLRRQEFDYLDQVRRESWRKRELGANAHSQIATSHT